MKTKKVRPVLIETKEPTNIFKGGSILFYSDLKPQTGHSINSSIIGYKLILISLDINEKFQVGDKYLDDCGLIREAVTDDEDYWSRRPEYKKVIATHDQLSPELIQKLVDEYNNGGMKDFDIEMTVKDCLESHEGNTIYEPLLVNGFVTVVKENANDFTNGWGNLSKEQLDTIHPKKFTREQAMGDNKELVDFEMLVDIPHIFEALVDEYAPQWDDKSQNLKLFFQKLSESGSFAHRAHKELQRLNK